MYAYTRTRWLVALAAMALVGGLVGCGGGGGGGGGKKTVSLTVGDLVPLTGDLSPFGPPGRKASDLAIAQIKQAARAAGVSTNVSVQHADTETDPQAAVQAARQLISRGAGCIAGPWASAETLAVGQSVATRQRTPIISPSSTSAQITDLKDRGFVDRTAPSDNLQARALADVVAQELGGANHTVSLAARNDAYGQGFIDKFKQAWQAKGGTARGPVLYDPAQPSYNSEAAQITSGNPDAYVLIDFFETYAKMGAALVRTGRFDAGKLFTADGLASDTIPSDIPGKALIGARGTRPATPATGVLIQRFAQLYNAAPGPGRQTFDGQNFDATMLCYLAALAAGSSRGSDIAAKLQSVSAPPGKRYTFMQLSAAIKALANGDDIDFDGVSGPINLDANGDPTTATYEVYRYDAKGKLGVVRQFQAKAQGGS